MKYKIPVSEFLKELAAGNLNLRDFHERFSKELKKLSRKFNFMITITEEALVRPGKGRLPGLPVSVKDCICTKGIQSTAGSRILEGYKPIFESTSVQRVRDEGALIAGKTAQDEFGFGTFSTNCAYGIPKNPVDPTRSCGGSSGGAAGLTAAMEYPHIALAESTGGSISCPASFCGVVGLTPTYGLVSRHGLIDYANSLDKIGPIARRVEDAALMLSVIAGHDARDSTSINSKPQDYTKSLKGSVKGMKIGIPREYFGEGVDSKIAEKVMEGISVLEELGAKCSGTSLPTTEYAIPAYYIIATSEASTNLAKFCGMRYGKEDKVAGNFNEYFSSVRTKYFGKEAKRRILLGTFARMAGYRDQYYLKAMKARTLIIKDFKRAFSKFDVLAAPTMPILPPKLRDIARMSPLEAYMMDILTVAPNLAGIPHLSVPCGTVKNLPVGLHLLGNHLQEAKILKTGYNFEKSFKV